MAAALDTTPTIRPRPPFTLSRYTIHTPLDGDKPRSRRALNATLALGAVLNKPKWWTKWTQRPDVRATWMHELTTELIRLNVTQVLRAWPARGGVWHALAPICDVAESTGDERTARLTRICEHVLYPPPHASHDGFGLGVDYESDDEWRTSENDRRDAWHPDPHDAYEASAIDDDDACARVLAHHETQNAFGQIGWYLAMETLRDELRRNPERVVNWTRSTPRASAELDTLVRSMDHVAAWLISQVVQDERPCTLELVRSHFPDETRPNVLRLLHRHFEKIGAFLDATKQDLSIVLALVIQYARLHDEARTDTDGVMTPGPVPQTWLGDGLIPLDLKRTFVRQVAVLENVPADQKDWHPTATHNLFPATKDLVLNLVHPSLYCGILDTTPVLSTRAPDAPVLTVAAHMRWMMAASTPDRLTSPAPRAVDRIARPTKFQWLPSEFDVQADGQATTIRSYINNLHPETHADLYDSIAAIFTRFVPLFDHVLSTLDDTLVEKGGLSNAVHDAQKQGSPVRTVAADRDAVVETLTRALGDGTHPSSSLRRLVPPGLFESAHPRFSLKGRRCQVIVKTAEIVLTPDKPRYPGGTWHVEGTAAERIVATGLYYFASENISESRLSFRVFVNPPEVDQDDFVGVGLSYGLLETSELVQALGAITALEDRCVVFPNVYQHRVEPFYLADATKPGVRKILAFFLVDPVNEPIVSTLDVPPQQADWIERAVREGETTLPRSGMSHEAANTVRLELMKERGFVLWETMQTLSFSLCEH